MSALTFETLSAQLTQSLAEQSDTPPQTTARCTLGRDKVMVLVEYPIDSTQAEPIASETLDWLEQQLRRQFDTAGLPEAAADVAETRSEISVQLFLKHFSEPKPFTMRSFIWKVDDGFDDLFGSASTASRVAERSLHQNDSSQLGRTRTVTSVVPRLDQSDNAPFFHSASAGDQSLAEDQASAEEANDVSTTDMSATGISAIQTGVFPETIADEQPVFASPPSEAGVDAVSVDAVSVEALADMEEEVPSELGDEDLQLDIEPDLALDPVLDIHDDSDSTLPISTAADSLLAEQSMSLTLPGDSPEFEPDDFSLPTVEIPGVNVPDINPVHADFFNVDRNDTASTSLVELSSADLTADLAASFQGQADGETVDSVSEDNSASEDSGSEIDIGLDEPSDSAYLSDYNLSGSALETDPTEGESVSVEPDEIEPDAEQIEIEPIEFELIEPEAAAYKPTTDDTNSEALTDEDGSAESKYAALYEDDLHEDDLHEDDLHEAESYEDDPVYYLEGEGGDDEPLEDVAAVEEGEVQRQREQWEQQSQSNPWFFAGALGFLMVGILGFVLTRPCTFGSCDRIQTAQQAGEDALTDLRIDSSLASVTDAKKQLKRSVSLLAPIPIWSPFYRQAQTILPEYEDQVRSLDYVTSAQEKAYSAAVASQDPPHPVSHWQQIAEDWRTASEMLEAVPSDSPVRELADRKLTEYRANRATILVRIDSEAKAEVGIRQAQQAAILGTKQIEAAGSLADWEEALASWESAVDSLSQIPQGTNAHGEAQKLLPEYLKTLEEVRANTEVERNASRSLFQAKQLAAEAQRAEADEQWSAAVENWQAASRQLQDTPQGTLAFSEAEALKGIYATSLGKADNNFQVAMRFQPVEPNFFAVCGMAGTQKCTYSVQSGSVRLDLFQGYDTVIDQAITPPDQRVIEASTPQLVGQSNQLLQEIAMLGTQAQVPVEMYNAQGEFVARYRPDLSGFTR